MFPIDEASIWERRDAVLAAQEANAAALPVEWPQTTLTLAQAAVASSDDVPRLLDALVQVYGDLLSERQAIDETMDTTDGPLIDGFGRVHHG